MVIREKSVGLIFIMLILIPWGTAAMPGDYSVVVKEVPTEALIWAISCADLDKDDKNEMILGGVDDTVYVTNPQGRELWRCDVHGLPLSIVAGDIAGDEEKEIAAVSLTNRGDVRVLGYKQGLLWAYSAEQAFLCVAVGDLDANGKEEVVAGGFSGTLLALDGTGKLRWKRQVCEESSIGSIATGNILGDFRPEIVVGTSKHGVYALDSQGNVVWHLKPRIKKRREAYYKRFWIRSIMIDDINGDGRNEVITGSRPCGMVTVISGDGRILWEKDFPDIVNKWSTSQVAVGNLVGDSKKEIVCLLHGIVKEGNSGTSPVFVLDADGRELTRWFPKRNFFSLTMGDKDNKGYSKALLSSSTRGHYLHELELRQGQLASPLQTRHRDNLDSLISLTEKSARSAKTSRGSKFHVLLAVKPNLTGQSLENLSQLLRSMASTNLEFGLMLHGIYELGPKMPKRAKRVRSRKQIIDIVRAYETRKMPFYVVIGKMCKLHMQIETIEEILKTAPDFCRGFIVNEDSHTHGKKHEKFVAQLEIVMSFLRKHGEKKLIMNEHTDYWSKVPLLPGIRDKLFKPENRNILVPMYKTNRLVAPEQNVGMILGLWKAGVVKDWGLSAQDDLWKWESIFMNPPPDVLLRMEVMAASLGATYFRIEANGEFLEERNQRWFLSDGAKRHRGLFHALVRKGIVRPVSSSGQVVVCPSALNVQYDRSQISREPHRTYWQNIYGLSGPLAYKLSLQTVDADYVPGLVYGMKHFYDGLFPQTPYGFVPIVPGWVDPLKIPGVKDYWVVGGQTVYGKDMSKLSAGKVRETLISGFKEHAQGLPFLADNTFMAINRFEDGYTVYLMDPGHLDISDTHTTLRVNTPLKSGKIVDAISGEILQYKDGKIDVKIPAGAFRILEIPYPREQQRQNDQTPKAPREVRLINCIKPPALLVRTS
jgi:hypothetical protein